MAFSSALYLEAYSKLATEDTRPGIVAGQPYGDKIIAGVLNNAPDAGQCD
jgi:hypothetical protein